MSVDSIFSITLPDEIVTEIFSRVPAKTVGKFRCLSKTWLTILSASYFINLHLSRNTNQESMILLTQYNLHTIKPPFFENTRELELGNGNSWTKLLGSCNGIVLLLNQEDEMFLVNPTTLEQFKVPSIYFNICGLGYDSSSNEYKIVTVFCHYFSRTVQVYVYSFKLGIWRRIKHSLHYWFHCGSWVGYVINGRLNWIINRKKSGVLFTILVFDLATEVFHEIDVSSNNGLPCCPNASWRVFVRGGCLCTTVLTVSGNKRTEDIWIMKEYGKVSSWTKLASFDVNGKWWMYNPLWICENKIVLIAYEELFPDDDEKTMIEYNVEDGTVKEMVVNAAATSLTNGLSFVNSLVSFREFTSSS